MLLGHHLLHGQVVELSRPLLVTQKTKVCYKLCTDTDYPTKHKSDVHFQVDTKETVLNNNGFEQHMDLGDENLDSSSVTNNNETASSPQTPSCSTQYTIIAIIKQKIVFKDRPKPIVANVSKKVI